MQRLRLKVLFAIALVCGAVAIILACLQVFRLDGPDELVEAASLPALVDASSWPAVEPLEGYATSQSCKECHAEQYDSWHASYHRSMTQPASRASVIGPFDDVVLSYLGDKYRLETDGDRYWVELPNGESPDGKPLRKQIVLCTGSHHMQVYWFPTNESRVLAQLPFVYLIGEQRWAPRNAAFLRPPMRQATFERGRWNETCVKCHATGARPLIDNDMQMDTRVTEFGIACESCHGPGAAHAEEHGGQPRQDALHLADRPNQTIVNPATLSHRRSAEVCGQCHSVTQFASDAHREHWNRDGFAYRPGGDLSEERSVVRGTRDTLRIRNLEQLRLIASAFWSDGMVRVAGREYNGLVETACFQHGEMSCLSCHTMHKAEGDERSNDQWANDQLKPAMRGNQACTQCHQQYSDDEVLVGHTHHGATSEGSKCYNCHMPHATYGLLKFVRSHQITIPSVAASIETGRPNACNQCHLDQTLDWAARGLSAWYGVQPPELSVDERNIAASVLWTLQGDAAQRALMAWTFGWGPAQQASGTTWMAPFLSELINDPYDAVRYIAYESLQSIERFTEFQFDYMASPPEREAAQQRVMSLWQDLVRRQSSPRIGQSLLLDIAGELRREKYALLLHDRDLRPVTLIE